MNILQVASSFPPAYAYGGIVKVVFEISTRLVRQGHDVTVFTTDVLDSESRHEFQYNPEMINGVNVFRFKNLSNKFAYKGYFAAPRMALAIKNQIENFDIVHLHEYRSLHAIFTHYYSSKFNKPLVLQAHGSIPIIIEKQRQKLIFDSFYGYKILRDAMKMIAVSDAERKQYLKMNIPIEKVTTIPNGISFNHDYISKKGQFRRLLGISDNTKLILFVGRLHKRKGVDFLLNAFNRLLEYRDDIVLVIIGADEGCKGKLFRLAKRHNIEKRVLFLGYIVDVTSAYVDANVLVYPSVHEIFGLVPFESITYGLPVIVTDDCGCGELIKEGKCGYLVKYGDIDDLSEKINYLLENPGVGEKMVERGQRFIRDNLSWDMIVNNIEITYESCLHNV